MSWRAGGADCLPCRDGRLPRGPRRATGAGLCPAAAAADRQPTLPCCSGPRIPASTSCACRRARRPAGNPPPPRPRSSRLRSRRQRSRRRLPLRHQSAPRQPPQSQGRVVKLTVKIGSQSTDTAKGMARRAHGYAGAAAGALARSPQRQRRADPRGGGQQPGRTGGASLRRYRRRSQRPRRHAHERAAPARGVDDAGHGRGAGSVARHHRRRRFPADAAPAGAMAATPTSCFVWAGCTQPASAWRATRWRPSPGTARARPPATRAP